MQPSIRAMCLLALCCCVGCGPSTGNVGDVQAAALAVMFSAETLGDVPSDREYFAVTLLDKRPPDADFLGRFAAQRPKVITYAEGLAREPREWEAEHQTAGLYFTVHSIDWVNTRQATVEISVGNGWCGVHYHLQLKKTKGRWKCVDIERGAIS